MSNRYLDFFEDSYYINLNHRIDRKELFEKRSREVGITANRFSAIEPREEDCPLLPSSVGETRRKYKVGCSLSHQGIIKIAKERNLENVLIFEDDCIFLENFENEAAIKTEILDEARNHGSHQQDILFINEKLINRSN